MLNTYITDITKHIDLNIKTKMDNFKKLKSIVLSNDYLHEYEMQLIFANGNELVALYEVYLIKCIEKNKTPYKVSRFYKLI